LLAGWFHGRPPHHRGLVDLAMAHSYGDLAGALDEVAIDLPDTDVRLLSGVRSPGQAPAVAAIWAELAATLAHLHASAVDVLVDAGRLGLEHAPAPLLDAADAVLITTRATLPAISAARGWARELTQRFAVVGTLDHLGLLLIGPGHTYGAAEVKDALGLPLVATLPWDPRSAQALHLGESSRRLRRGPLASALRSSVAAIETMAAGNRARVHGGAAPASLPGGVTG
jgi:hypothetical protein